jgi:hypothetical protein
MLKKYSARYMYVKTTLQKRIGKKYKAHLPSFKNKLQWPAGLSIRHNKGEWILNGTALTGLSMNR